MDADTPTPRDATRVFGVIFGCIVVCSIFGVLLVLSTHPAAPDYETPFLVLVAVAKWGFIGLIAGLGFAIYHSGRRTDLIARLLVLAVGASIGCGDVFQFYVYHRDVAYLRGLQSGRISLEELIVKLHAKSPSAIELRGVCQGLSSNQPLSSEASRWIAEHLADHRDILNSLASYESAPPDVLRQLFASHQKLNDDLGILFNLAENPATPMDVLQQLANSPNGLVRQYAKKTISQQH